MSICRAFGGLIGRSKAACVPSSEIEKGGSVQGVLA